MYDNCKVHVQPMGVRGHWSRVLQSVILKESLHDVPMSSIQGKLHSRLSILYVMRIVDTVTESQSAITATLLLLVCLHCYYTDVVIGNEYLWL